MKRALSSWGRSVAESVPSGAFSAVLVGAWLALTVLFTVVGVSLVGTVATAAGHPRGAATFLVTLAGALGACAVAPTLVQATVVRTVERATAHLDREDDAAAGRLFDPRELKEAADCRSRRGCCC